MVLVVPSLVFVTMARRPVVQTASRPTTNAEAIAMPMLSAVVMPRLQARNVLLMFAMADMASTVWPRSPSS